jgi:cytochrome P450
MPQAVSSDTSLESPPLPPGPGLPSVLQLLLLYKRPTEFLNDCAAKYGTTFTLRIPGTPPFIQTSEPALIEAIFKGDPEIFQAGRANVGLKPVVGINSLLLLDGASHRRERKLIMPTFLGKRMHAYGLTIREIVNRYIDRWPLQRPITLLTETQDATFEIISRLVFGFDDAKTIAGFGHHIHRILKLAFLLFPNSDGEIMAERPARWLGKVFPRCDVFAALKSVDDMIDVEYQKRISANFGDREDVLSLLVRSRYDDGRAMSRAEIRDELMTLLMAGHETSATTLAWSLYHLCRHPEALERLQEEIQEHGRGNPIPLEAIPQLKYLDAVLKETMRITPVFSLVARVLKESQTIAARTYPAEVVLSPNIYGTHHRPDLWGDPEAFRPERFLNGEANPFHYFPFGGGTRICIGMNFAFYEMKIFIAEVVRRTRFSLARGYQAKVVRRNNTLAPSRGVPLILNAKS